MGASKTRSQVLPPTRRFTNWEQWSRCVLLQVFLLGVVSTWRKRVGVTPVEVMPVLHSCSAMDTDVSRCYCLFLMLVSKSFEFKCVAFLSFVTPSSTGTVYFTLVHSPHTLKMLPMETPEQISCINLSGLFFFNTQRMYCKNSTKYKVKKTLPYFHTYTLIFWISVWSIITSQGRCKKHRGFKSSCETWSSARD